MTTPLPQADLQLLPFEDHTKSHVAWLVRFMAGVLTSRNGQFYNILQQEYPEETLKLAFGLRQLYKKLDPRDTEVYQWEATIQEHLEERPPEQGDSNGSSSKVSGQEHSPV